MKFFLTTFGCRVNQYEGQELREGFLASGATAVDDFREADACLINTCTVTAEADQDALSLVRSISRNNPSARLVVAGCLAERDPTAILRAAPHAEIYGNALKSGIPALFSCRSLPPGEGITAFEGKSRAFIKIQDGCGMRCSYCVIPSIRPRISSRPPDAVLAEIRRLLDSGRSEIVLCGIRLGRYLWEPPGGRRYDFLSLLEMILDLAGEFRVRLSSMEITDATDRFIRLAASSRGRLCPSLHIPLQSGCDATLKRMRRWYSSRFYAERASALKAGIHSLSLFSDVMAGFPGETQEDFEETLAFITATGFSGLHPFRYSKRPGTEAAGLSGHLPEDETAQRAKRLRNLDQGLRAAFSKQALGMSKKAVPLSGGHEALCEDFLTVKMESPLSPGIRPVRVTRVEGPRAWAVPE